MANVIAKTMAAIAITDISGTLGVGEKDGLEVAEFAVVGDGEVEEEGVEEAEVDVTVTVPLISL